MKVHILGDGPDVNVWLGHDPPPSGMVIGVGQTTYSAIEHAIKNLVEILGQLHQHQYASPTDAAPEVP